MRPSRARLLPVLTLALAILAVPRGADADVVSRFVDVDGLSIHLLDTGPQRGDLPAAILVHGWAGSAADFLPLLELLADDRRWIAFDFPGCGQSDAPDIHYTISGMADFVERLRGALGTGAVDLVGHSLGGQIAVCDAVRYPERVRRLVLIDPAGLAGEEGGMLCFTRLGPLVDLAFRLNCRGAIRRTMRRNIFHGTTGLEAAVDRTAAHLLTSGGSRAAARITREAVGTEPVDDLLSRVAQPTLVVWGVEDRLLPIRWADAWMQGLPQAEWCPVPACGHMPIAERPGETAVALEEFLLRP
jgi:abhydrolase domain-containing protein 6